MAAHRFEVFAQHAAVGHEHALAGLPIAGEQLPVQIVGDSPDGVWLAGLPERLRFITVGQDFVLTGQKVEPVPETAEPAS